MSQLYSATCLPVTPPFRNGKPLKAFVDIQLDNGIILREFRVIQEPNKRPWVASPQLSWKDPADGQVKYKTVITLPSLLKGQIDNLILSAWYGMEEKRKDDHPS